MTDKPSPTPMPAVSARLIAPLRRVAERDWVMRVGRGIFQLAAWCLLIWLVIVLLLGFWNAMPLLLRLALAAAAWVMLAWGAFRFVIPAFRRRSLALAAQDVERALPEVQERISSAVELSQNNDSRFRGSPELIAHLVRQAEADAQSLDPFVVIPSRTLWRWVLVCVGLLLLWLTLAAAFPPAVTRGLARTVLPWNIAPPERAAFKVEPGLLEIPQGDPVRVTVQITRPGGQTEESPDVQLVSRFPGGQTTAQPMERLGHNTFSWQLDHALQSFSYQVKSPEGESDIYQVRVLSRPSIQGIEVTYTYPPYTGLPSPRVEKDKGGAIDAVVGTKARILVHASQPLTERSRILFASETPEQQGVFLQPAGAANSNDYAGELALEKPGQWQYTLHLVSLAQGQELTNAGDAPRSVIVRPDQSPGIAILSPAPRVAIRPDDAALVVYRATDDFGVSRITARVQIDQHEPDTFDLPVDAAHPRETKGQWRLSVADQLARKNLAAARQITYQLRVVDNSIPTPREAATAQYVLDIDSKVSNLAARQDEQAARDLTAAIQKASQTVQNARDRVQQIQKASADHPMTAAQDELAERARRDLAQTVQTLSDAASRQQESPFRDLAQEADHIAQEPIKQAADAVARARMATDQAKAQQENLHQAGQQLADARRRLEALQQRLTQADRQEQLIHQLEELKAKQQEIARALEQPDPSHPEKTAQAQQKQRELQEQVDKLIREHPELQQPARQAAAPQAEELQKKIEEMKAAQQTLADKTRKQAEAAQAAAGTGELAKQQEKLNQDINELAATQAMRDAGVQPPDKSQLDPIVKDLQSNKLATAEEAQRSAAGKLNQAADKLQRLAGKENNGQPEPKASPVADQAKKLAEQVDDLAKDIQTAKENKKPPVRPGDAPNQKAQELAQQIQKEAAKAAAANPASRQAADDARTAAQEARQAAAQGKADAAQQKLTTAVEKLQQAAARPGAPAADDATHKQMQEAAKQASELAARQEKLAQQTSAAAKGRDAAAQQEQMQQDAQQQQQLAEQLEQAARQAQQMQRDAQSTTPDLAERARQASENLQKAAQQQRQAAAASKQNDAQKAAAAQQEAARQVQQAGQGLQDKPQTAENPGQHPQENGQVASSGRPGAPAPQPRSGVQPAPASNVGQPQNQGSPGAVAPPSSGQEASPSDPAQQRVAESLFKARQAQQEAARGNPQAARNAAEALAQAQRAAERSSDASSAAGGQQRLAPNFAGTPQPNQPGSGGGQDVRPTTAPAKEMLPDAVKEIGISPSDWARLPPAMQQELLNAAQQKGPPAYQEAIRGYYLRIARLKSAPASEKP